MIHVVLVGPTSTTAVIEISNDPDIEEVEIPHIVKKSRFNKWVYPHFAYSFGNV